MIRGLLMSRFRGRAGVDRYGAVDSDIPACGDAAFRPYPWCRSYRWAFAIGGAAKGHTAIDADRATRSDAVRRMDGKRRGACFDPGASRNAADTDRPCQQSDQAQEAMGLRTIQAWKDPLAQKVTEKQERNPKSEATKSRDLPKAFQKAKIHNRKL